MIHLRSPVGNCILLNMHPIFLLLTCLIFFLTLCETLWIIHCRFAACSFSLCWIVSGRWWNYWQITVIFVKAFSLGILKTNLKKDLKFYIKLKTAYHFSFKSLRWHFIYFNKIYKKCAEIRHIIESTYVSWKVVTR